MSSHTSVSFLRRDTLVVSTEFRRTTAVSNMVNESRWLAEWVYSIKLGFCFWLITSVQYTPEISTPFLAADSEAKYPCIAVQARQSAPNLRVASRRAYESAPSEFYGFCYRLPHAWTTRVANSNAARAGSVGRSVSTIYASRKCSRPSTYATLWEDRARDLKLSTWPEEWLPDQLNGPEKDDRDRADRH